MIPCSSISLISSSYRPQAYDPLVQLYSCVSRVCTPGPLPFLPCTKALHIRKNGRVGAGEDCERELCRDWREPFGLREEPVYYRSGLEVEVIVPPTRKSAGTQGRDPHYFAICLSEDADSHPRHAVEPRADGLQGCQAMRDLHTLKA